jgi:hypothetical protein
MKQLSILVTFILVLASCNTGGPQINTENLPVVENYIRAIQDKNIDRLGLLLADDFKGFGPSVNDSTDKAGSIAKWKGMFDAANSIEFINPVSAAGRVDNGPYPGDYITCWSTVKITLKDNRGPLQLPFNSILRIENGKINVARTLMNEADTLRQLGYQFTPPAQ